MFLDGRSLDGESLEFDLCIVGGGAAGIAIAHEFIGSSLRVAIIESGGMEPDKATLELNKGNVTGRHYSIESSRLRWFGGSTNHWEGMCAPFDELDFKERTWVRHSGWPITHDKLYPYYARAAKFLNMSGDTNDDFSVPQNLIESNNVLSFGCWRFAKHLSLGEVYRQSLEQATNIKAILNANLIDIKLTDTLSSVSEMHFSTLAKQKFTIKAKRYVLACGGLENARLLLASNKQYEKGVGNWHDNVGRYFMEHPHHEAGNLFSFGSDNLAKQFHLHFKKSKGLSAVNDGLIANTSGKTLNIKLSEAAQQKYKVGGGSLVINTTKIDQRNGPTASLLSHVFGYQAPTKKHGLYIRTEQVPNPDSRVTLSVSQKDALGMPRLQLHWMLKEQDWHTIHILAKMFAISVSANDFGVVRLYKWLGGSVKWPKHLGWGGHHMGTTRMHENVKYGVVDKDCKVHGVDNLYIAGSSVFPTSSWANPTFTIVALSTRLTDHFKRF
ncbi:MAG: GMC family oxidoreductase [Rickettsiales bacterium]